MDKKTSQYIIDQIRQKYRITDYLDEKGYVPKRRQGNRWSYVCPIHKDTDPSFSLYLAGGKSDYDNYFCFGCKASGDIISLTAELDYGGRSGWGSAIRHLSGGLNLTTAGELDFIVEELKKQLEGNGRKAEAENPFDEYALKISGFGHRYLKMTNYDPAEIAFLESVYKKIDQYIVNYDLESLEQAWKYICDEDAFSKRYQAYSANKEEEERIRAATKVVKGSKFIR